MKTSDKDTAVIRIENIVYRGSGLGRLDGLAVFVPGAAAGEQAEIKITERKKNFARGKIIKLLEPSSKRVKPQCPLALNSAEINKGMHCPGCVYQHISYEEEIRIKNAQLKEMMCHKVRGIADDAFLPPVFSDACSGYRNKITFHIFRGKRNVSLGYFGEDNRTVLDVPECPLAEKPINLLLDDLRRKSGFISSLRTGDSIVIRHTLKDGAQYTVSRALPTKDPLTEHSPAGELSVPFNSFFQVNRSVGGLLVNAVSELVKLISPRNVIDLYCGIGVFSFIASQAGAGQVIGIESDEEAVKAAVFNARALGVAKADFIAGRVESSMKKLPASLHSEETCLLLDPPRSGAGGIVIENILSFRPADILYISCAPDTLARDLQNLCSEKYEIRTVRMFDMFPRTPYFETLVHLSLK